MLKLTLLTDGTRVIDQRGHRPQLGIDALKQVNDLVFDTDIGFDRDGFGAQFADVGQHPLGRLVVTQIVDADAIPFTGRQACGRGANTTTGASDHDDFIHGYSFAPMAFAPQG
ncbi:hypothetical protein D3C76_1446230 [compost metagenome]